MWKHNIIKSKVNINFNLLNPKLLKLNFIACLKGNLDFKRPKFSTTGAIIETFESSIIAGKGTSDIKPYFSYSINNILIHKFNVSKNVAKLLNDLLIIKYQL